ncbi:MAG: DUF192 domain-containing protein [Actinobacteria bacterium]|uniref:Unannotated protein n=1 Tax=freshwater metagenome TaxID=449393 RepID=A0A6J6M3W9_9ZZZZ|nr:DUF192 domain-containing protein [Actinomycetota bacterium]
MTAHTGRSIEPVWLVSQGRVVASAGRATSRTDRRRGLIGMAAIPEPLLLDPCSWVHTMGMKTAIDVAYVDSEGIVLRIDTMKPWRVGQLTRKAQFVIEASTGSFERWNVRVGDTIEVRHVDH